MGGESFLKGFWRHTPYDAVAQSGAHFYTAHGPGSAHATQYYSIYRWLSYFIKIPNSVTELQLSGDWRDWTPEKLGRLERMKLLNLSSTHLKAIEASQLESFPRLSAIDLSSNDFSQMPQLLPGITQLYMSNNPLKELTPKDLLMFDGLRKVALGGDRTGWECDCDAPSPLQRWLRDQGNREKVKDLSSIYCALPLHGRVQIVKTLPDTNGTLCAKEEPETSSWVKMMKNLEDRTSTIVIGVFEFSTTAQPSTTDVHSVGSRTPFLWLDGKGVPTHRYSPQRTTWKPPKRKAREDPDDSHRFLNALIFVLFLAVILLIIAVGITLYFRFTRTDVYIGSQHKVASEQRPLNA